MRSCEVAIIWPDKWNFRMLEVFTHFPPKSVVPQQKKSSPLPESKATRTSFRKKNKTAFFADKSWQTHRIHVWYVEYLPALTIANQPNVRKYTSPMYPRKTANYHWNRPATCSFFVSNTVQPVEKLTRHASLKNGTHRRDMMQWY